MCSAVLDSVVERKFHFHHFICESRVTETPHRHHLITEFNLNPQSQLVTSQSLSRRIVWGPCDKFFLVVMVVEVVVMAPWTPNHPV